MTAAEWTMSVEMGCIYGMVALGIYLTFHVIDFADLTCDGSFVLGAATSSICIKSGWNPWMALVLASLAGGFAGYATALLYTRCKIKDLLAGILVAFMLYSVNLRVMGGLPNITLTHQMTLFTGSSPLFLLAGGSWLFCSYLLSSDWGLALQSVGQNRKLALNCGVAIEPMIQVGLSLSNGFIAMGGALFSQHQRFADISSGTGTVIVGLAAVMIGQRILPLRSPWIALLSCFLGSILYRILMSVALHSELLGLETRDLNLVTGLLIILVMLIGRKKSCSH